MSEALMIQNEQPKPEQETRQEAPIKETKEKVDISDLEERIKKLVQSESDRIRTEYSQKLKAAEKENEMLRMEKMSEKEKREFEVKQRDEALAKKERELTDKEMRLLAIDELKKSELDTGFVDYVLGNDKDATVGRIAQLKTFWQKAIDSAIDTRMKAAGREPAKGRVAGETSGISGMTPREIQKKAQNDPEWAKKNVKD
jgi:hypothetical protein